jgi:multicomponent K+:H+ antiporter subunit A
MLDSALTGRAGQRLSKVQTGPRPGEPHSLILSVSTRILLPLAVMAGVYIFLRGHNQPGGGFIAGIVIGIAFIMQYIASGYVWSNQRVRFDPQALIGWGILLAASTGMAAWLFGYPFLTSTHGHFHVPLIGHIELASVILFDLGVFSTVVGILLISLANLSRVEQPDGGDGAGEEFIEPAADAPPSGIPPSAAVALKAQREGI